MMGALMVAQEKLADAEALFAKAIDVAGSQNAKGWELRAAVGYARLMKQQERQEQALRRAETRVTTMS
jgi:hypothetical protein